MNVVQIVALIVVAISGGVVVLVGEPLRQTLTLGIYGIALTFLFFAFQAPDVALSEVVITSVGLPLIILSALRKIREHERARSGEDE